MAETDRDRVKVLEAGQRSLEAVVSDLLARMDRLDPPKKVTAATVPVDEERARTLFPRTTSIAMPTHAEFLKLFGIAERSYPKYIPELSGDWERAEFVRKCGFAFEHLTSLRRSDQMNTKFYIGGFVDRANVWLGAQGSPAIEAAHFFTAVLMAGDICFQLANPALGLVLAFGLTTNSDAITASSAGWKGVLERGAPRPPIEPVVQREHSTLVRMAR